MSAGRSGYQLITYGAFKGQIGYCDEDQGDILLLYLPFKGMLATLVQPEHCIQIDNMPNRMANFLNDTMLREPEVRSQAV